MNRTNKTWILLFGLAFALAGLAPGRTVNLDERFRRLDRDGDGKVTPQEFPRPLLFRKLDRNGDRLLTLKEVQEARLAPAAGANQPAGEVKTRRDLAYGKDKAQGLDLYVPKAPKKAPVMLYIHGGGWRKGDKRAVGLKASF